MLRVPSDMLKCDKCGMTHLKEEDVTIVACSECGRPYFKHIGCGGILKTDQSRLPSNVRSQKIS